MNDTITTTGIVATAPRTITTSDGLVITSFRLAALQRTYNAGTQEAKEVTNWYTVTAFRQLAENMFHSLGKGDRVVVAGRLRIREWEDGEKSGTTVEIDAATVGHDLNWGTSAYTRRHTPAVETETGAELEPQADLPF